MIWLNWPSEQTWFSVENLADLKEITTYNLSARYDDYKKVFMKRLQKLC